MTRQLNDKCPGCVGKEERTRENDEGDPASTAQPAPPPDNPGESSVDLVVSTLENIDATTKVVKDREGGGVQGARR